MDFTKPQLLRGWASRWLAMQRWTPDFLRATYGHLSVELKRPRAGERLTVTLRQYFDGVHDAAPEGEPWYLADWQIRDDIDPLRADYAIPDPFRCWSEALPPAQQPGLRWLYIGPAGSGKPLHTDVMATAAWNAVIAGAKRWRFYPPDATEILDAGAVDVFHPDLNRHPRFVEAIPIELVQLPGDLVYTPSLWWHQVVNDEPCISVTENFVNALDAEPVLAELTAQGQTHWLELFSAFRPAQASGLRQRTSRKRAKSVSAEYPSAC